MTRAWIILSTLTLGVIFKLWKDEGQGMVGFVFSDKTLNTQSYIYFLMEHVNAIAIGFCVLIQDDTPRWLIQLFILILLIDLFHYLLFFRDEGIGFNLAKVLCFGLPLLWIQLRQSWNQ
jgi:hypothetical protein